MKQNRKHVTQVSIVPARKSEGGVVFYLLLIHLITHLTNMTNFEENYPGVLKSGKSKNYKTLPKFIFVQSENC